MAADDTKKTPWGDALAPFERDAKTTWIDLGPVWLGEGGSLQLTLHVEPLHWRSHGAERRIVIKPREQQRTPSRDEQADEAKRTYGPGGKRGAR